MHGPVPAAKVTLRCTACMTNYRYDQYGGEAKGYRYYDCPQPYIRASNTACVEWLCYAQWPPWGKRIIVWTSKFYLNKTLVTLI